MSVTGEIKNLYSDKDKTRVLLPRTKTKAVSDENGTSLDVLLDGKAPAGYGLGEEPPIVIDANNATSPGFYRFNGNSCANIPSEWQFLYGTMIVSRGTAFIEQVLLARKINAKRTHTINEGWSEWEYINPPMLPGVEYRTTERWNNAPVYTAILELGTAPNSTSKSLSHPPEIKPTRVIGWSGYMVNTDNVSIALPTISDTMEVQIDNYGASLFTKSDRSNFYVYLKIKYIK